MRTIAGQAQMKPKPTILKVRIEKGRCVCVLRLDKRAGSSVVAERLAQLLHTKPAVIRSLPTACREERRWQTTNQPRLGGPGCTLGCRHTRSLSTHVQLQARSFEHKHTEITQTSLRYDAFGTELGDGLTNAGHSREGE